MNPRSGRSFDLVRDVLDHELVDADGESCGVVDDVELALSGSGAPEIVALLVGPGAVRHRLPALLAWMWTALAGRRLTNVPWAEVDRIAETVTLRSKASALGLGRADRRTERWLKRLPGA